MSGQVFIVQMLSVIDASATNSLHCSLSSAMSHCVILCLPDVFPDLVALALLRSSSTQSIYLFNGRPCSASLAMWLPLINSSDDSVVSHA